MKKVVVILGPTAVGKTKLSVELAKKINGEIINADSTQVFKDLNIATAKVKDEEKENIPHHLFDIKNVTEEYSVYDYQKDARNCINDILKRGKVPILVGGTGLYIKAALYDYHFEENSIRNDYSKCSNEQLYKKLLQIDPNSKIHINNRKRIERFLDYYNDTGKIISENKTDTILYDVIFIGLTMDRNILYERINNRVDLMVKDGLLEEAKKIFESKIRSKAIMTPIGYKELFPFFNHEKSLEQCLMMIKQNSRRYAKRQYTFFRHQLPVEWVIVDIEHFDQTILNVYNKVLQFLKK